jgi:hypothetical protein
MEGQESRIYPVREILIYTTLQNKTDVTITYTPLSAQTEGPVQFLDRVEYSKAGSSKRSIIDGVDTQQDHPTHFRWRGKGILMIATSRWQLLGCGSGDDGEEPWALTFFEKTWFTPAGMDIYSRTPQGLSVPLVEEILAKVKGLQGDVAAIADGFFEVERNKS